MLAAIRSVRHMGASGIGVAVLVALGNALRGLHADIASVLCPHPAEPAPGVGVAYADFPQVTDDEVRDPMTKASGRPAR